MMNEPTHEWLADLLQEGVYIVPGENNNAAERNADAETRENDENSTESLNSENTHNSPLPSPKFRGDNKKHILILTPSQPDAAEEELLSNIMSATGLAWEDIALINWNDQPRPDLLGILESHMVISFGLEHDPWCDAELYRIHHANGVTHLRADALQSLNAQTELKRKLWTALKEMFGV